MQWDQGYVSEIDYTYGYYSEFNPLQIKLNLISAGIKPPKINTACELGFGQGVSLLCNAASSDISWYGNDFNPNQVAFVNEAIQSSGLELNVTDESFEDFCARTDLPNFDFIALHGIWSWISDSNRKIISKFIAKKLNVGGVLYISYNSEPGRTAMRPFRELMQWHASKFSNSSSMTEKIDSSISFMTNLLDTDPVFKTAHPSVVNYFKEFSSMDRHYLAHEFFNADWEPMSIKRLSEMLSDCKLQFASSTNPIDLLPSVNLTKQQLQMIEKIQDPIFKEFTKDMCINQGFRRDLWIKGGRRLSSAEKMAEIGAISVTLVTPIEDITFEVETALGKTNLVKEIYEPILKQLTGKSQIQLKELAAVLENKFSLTQLLEVCIILAAKRDLRLAYEDNVSENLMSKTSSLNNFFIDQSVFGSKVNFLTSSVTSTALPVNRFHQLFIRAHLENVKNESELATYVWNKLKAQDEKILVDGKILQSEDENLSHLKNLATKFLNNILPELKRLKVV